MLIVNELGEFQIISEVDELQLTDNLYPLFRKVRTITKMFPKSPIKNDILQKHTKEQFEEEIN